MALVQHGDINVSSLRVSSFAGTILVGDKFGVYPSLSCLNEL